MEEMKQVFEPILTNFDSFQTVLQEQQIVTDGCIGREEIKYCKIEAQQQCVLGTLCIPDLKNLKEDRINVAFYITKDNIVFADDDGIVQEVIDSVVHLNRNPYASKEKYLYYLLTGLISKASGLLENLEDSLMALEQEVLKDEENDFGSRVTSFRQELLVLRSYYEEVSDVGAALEEDENEYFDEDLLKYFGTVSDRAERLVNKSAHLLEYCKEVKDTYDSKISAKQNANMEFLTVLTSVFFPLTLITGWYGMNFTNMPELAGGYPFVIALSVVIVLLVVVLFKKKKML